MSGLPTTTSIDATAVRLREAAEFGTFSLLVLASDTYPPHRVDVTVLFGKHLAKRGHRVDWILQSEDPCPASYVTDWGSGKVWVGRRYDGTSLLGRVARHMWSIAHDMRLFGLLAGSTYDAIGVKDKFLSGVFGAVAAKVYRKPFVYWLSYPYPESYLLRAKESKGIYRILYWIRGTTFRHLLYRILLPAADHVIVQSQQMKRDVAREGTPVEKMTAVPMGVEVADMQPVAASAATRVIPEDVPSILYLGTLDSLRRLDFLIRVLGRVREQIPDAKLYLVGRGDHPEDEELLINEAKRLGLLPAVVFVGHLAREQALAYVRDAGVCVSPFYPTPILNSTSPTKLIEYMAMGKAVVANDHPEQRLVIEESGAGYCVPWDENAFGSAIVRILKDKEGAERMGALGRAYVAERRAYSVIADLVEQKFMELLRSGPPSS